MILYLISIVFGLIIMLSLIILILLFDQKAITRIKARITKVSPTAYSWKERFYGILDAINVPDQISNVVDRQMLVQAGIQMTHRQFLSMWWLLSLVGVFLGFLIIGFGVRALIGSLFLIAIILLFAIGPKLYLQYRIKARRIAVERSLPDFLDMLTLNLEVGIGFVPALKRINSGNSGVLGEEMGRALIQLELGFSRREALRELSDRIPSLDVANFVEATLLSERLGTSLARTMRVQANMQRSRRCQRAEIQARTAPIRIIPALVFFFLPGLLLIYLAPPIINFLLR